MSVLHSFLNEFSLSVEDIDYFSIDGWSGPNVLGTRSSYYSTEPVLLYNRLEKLNWYYNEQAFWVNNKVNQYQRLENEEQEIQTSFLGKSCLSFTHVYNHITSSYCSSPFSAENEESWILVFDGGIPPSLYYYDGKNFRFITHLLSCSGALYMDFFRLAGISKEKAYPETLSEVMEKVALPGKIMAYTALGSVNSELKSVIKTESNWIPGKTQGIEEILFNFRNLKPSDILTTLHQSLEELLVERLLEVTKAYNFKNNLCLSGGSFLNIIWNSTLKKSGFNTWVPPFVNDSGSSIGAACSARRFLEQKLDLQWDIYSGPSLICNPKSENWAKKTCSIAELAKLLFDTKQPAIVLNGKAELGPRALGNRSILCDATVRENLDLLNRLKKREWYRPVAPVCLAPYIQDYFLEDWSDPYMLYEHTASKKALKEVPAIVHLNGTCRLQSVEPESNSLLARILQEYYIYSGIPILCNTSANMKGCGFFQDIKSAQNWCEENSCNYIWNDGVLYQRLY